MSKEIDHTGMGTSAFLGTDSFINKDKIYTDDMKITSFTPPSYTITFHTDKAGQVGALDLNGPEITFTGNADAAAKMFFDFLINSFPGRLKEERERCAKVCEEIAPPNYYTEDEKFGFNLALGEYADAIRALDEEVLDAAI